MIYLQHTAEVTVPATMETALPAGLSSFYFSAAEAAVVETDSDPLVAATAAASSGFS